MISLPIGFCSSSLIILMIVGACGIFYFCFYFWSTQFYLLCALDVMRESVWSVKKMKVVYDLTVLALKRVHFHWYIEPEKPPLSFIFYEENLYRINAFMGIFWNWFKLDLFRSIKSVENFRSKNHRLIVSQSMRRHHIFGNVISKKESILFSIWFVRINRFL